MRLGYFIVLGVNRFPSLILVFDDALLVVRGDPGRETYKLLFGLVGERLVRSAARRDLMDRLTAIDRHGGDLTPAEAATMAGERQSRLLAVKDVKRATIALGSFARPSLTIYLPDKKLRFRFDPKETPVARVVDLLQPLLGDRLDIRRFDRL